MTDRKLVGYPYLVAWHRLSGSHNYYIKDLAARAAAENAPQDAVYRGQDGRWVTIGECREGGFADLVRKHVKVS